MLFLFATLFALVAAQGVTCVNLQGARGCVRECSYQGNDVDGDRLPSLGYKCEDEHRGVQACLHALGADSRSHSAGAAAVPAIDLQQLLNELSRRLLGNPRLSVGAADGVRTAEALGNFQRLAGLYVSKELDPSTATALINFR